MRRHKKFILSFALALSFNPAAQLKAVESTSQPVTVVEQAPLKKTSSAEDRRLETALQRLNDTALGREMLTFIQTENIAIRFAGQNAVDSDTKDLFGVQGLADPSTGVILINDNQYNADQLLMTVAHEIRHMWQNRTASIDKLALDPRREWLQDRFKEADAFAFQIHYAYEYARETKQPLVFSRIAIACEVRPSLACMYESYATLRDSGATPEEAYHKLVVDSFQLVKSLNYDWDFLRYQAERWQEAFKNPELARSYDPQWRPLSSDAEFVDTMRRVFTIGMDVEKGPQALARWSAEDFLSLEKTGGASDEYKSYFEEVQLLQKKAMDNYFESTQQNNIAIKKKSGNRAQKHQRNPASPG